MSMDEFRSHAGNAVTSAKGSQRKVLAKATDVTFDVVRMQDTNEDLLTPDYLFKPDPTPKIDEDKPFTKALRIKFNLSSSSYATMFLREVTRTSSAFSTQAAISKAN